MGVLTTDVLDSKTEWRTDRENAATAALIGRSKSEVEAMMGQAPDSSVMSAETSGVTTTRFFHHGLSLLELQRNVRFRDDAVIGVTSLIVVRPAGLPHNRLLVANVFPDETVEFSFAALTEQERQAIWTKCFDEPESRERAAQAEAETARASAEAVKSEQAATVQRQREEQAAADAAAAEKLRISEGEFGAGAYKPGGKIENPSPLKRVEPQYTSEAQRAKIQGEVELEVVVLASGGVGDIRVVRSLDHGLDDKAIEAARQWQFTPGTRGGSPVPVVVRLILEFRLH